MQMLLAASLAAAGHLDRAERVAYGIEDRFETRSPLIRLVPTHLDHRDQALLAVAAHAEAGSRPETSLAVAERINGPAERAAAFTAVARGLAKTAGRYGPGGCSPERLLRASGQCPCTGWSRSSRTWPARCCRRPAAYFTRRWPRRQAGSPAVGR
jgi:hypothetical protein